MEDESISATKEFNKLNSDIYNNYKPNKIIKSIISIDIDENIENKNYNSDNTQICLIEVNNNKYKNNNIIEEEILYEGYKFKLDNHKNKNYPKIINYRCINHRKNKRNCISQFCNSLKKRIIEKNIIFYILEK